MLASPAMVSSHIAAWLRSARTARPGSSNWSISALPSLTSQYPAGSRTTCRAGLAPDMTLTWTKAGWATKDDERRDPGDSQRIAAQSSLSSNVTRAHQLPASHLTIHAIILPSSQRGMRRLVAALRTQWTAVRRQLSPEGKQGSATPLLPLKLWPRIALWIVGDARFTRFECHAADRRRASNTIG